jgi:hypothetical protein
MRKPLLLILLHASFLSALAQSTNNLQDDLILVQKGDSFFIRPNITSASNKPLLTNLLRALGASATAYGLSHTLQADKKITISKSDVLPEIGLATFISAPKISGLISRNKMYLQYFIYDRQMKLVGMDIIPIDIHMLKRNSGNVPGIKISAPGFLRAELMTGKKTEAPYKNIGIVVVPGEKMLSEEDVPLQKIIPSIVPVVPTRQMHNQPIDISNGLITRQIIKAPIEIGKNNSIPVTKAVTKKVLALNRQFAKPTNTLLAPVVIARSKKKLNSMTNSNAAGKIPAKNASPVFHKGLLYIRRRKTSLLEEENGEGNSEEDALGYFKPEYMPPDDDDDDGEEEVDDDSEEEVDDDSGGGGCDGGDGSDGGNDGEILDQVPNSDASDYFDYIDTEGDLGYIYNYDGKGGEVVYTYDNLSNTWNISSWTGDFDPTDYNTTEPATTISEANAPQDFVAESGNDGYLITPNGSELLTYVYNDDITPSVLAAPNDPTLSENTQGVALQVQADIKAGNYLGAVKLIITTYGFVTTNSTISIISTGTFCITDGNVGTNQPQTVEIPIPLLLWFANNQIAFGTLVRDIGHEYQHVQQKSGSAPISNHAQREFLAYVYSLTAPNLPAEDGTNKALWKAELTKYYNQLSTTLQQQYKSVYQAALNS